MLPIQYKKIIENYIDAYNQMDVDRMVEDFDPTIEFENQIDGRIDLKITGYREFIDQAELELTYYERRKQSLSNWKFEGNTVRVDVEFEAILAAEYLTELNSENLIRRKGTSEYIFFGNKIIQILDKS